MPTLKVWPASAEAAADEAAALEAVPAAADDAEPPQPVRLNAETAAAPRATFRKLRRVILFMVFIAVAPSLERAAVTIRPAPLAERVCKYEKIPSLCVHPQGQDRNYDSAVPPCLLCCPPKPWPQSPSRRANTPLPCNGGFRPKLLKSILLPFARPSAAHEVLPRCRPFPSSGLSSRCAVQILFRLIGLIALYTLFS